MPQPLAHILPVLLTVEGQTTYARIQGDPPWMKYAGEPKLPWDVDPTRRVYSLSGVAWDNCGHGTPWRADVDAACGRFMRAVRR